MKYAVQLNWLDEPDMWRNIGRCYDTREEAEEQAREGKVRLDVDNAECRARGQNVPNGRFRVVEWGEEE